MNTRPYDYIAYVDEAGESGLQSVRPFDPKGSSEWLVMSGVVISADRESEVVPWVKDAMQRSRTQQKVLHFSAIRHDRAKAEICRAMADLPARYFVVASNKKNMVGHSNPLAEAQSLIRYGRPKAWRNDSWFYYWISRILLEKMSAYALSRSMKDYGEARTMRIEFSENQGLSYDELGYYYDLLKQNDILNTQTANYDHISWEVIKRDQLGAFRHEKRAGLQLADAVASAFFQACDNQQSGPCNPQFARLLRPRMAIKKGKRRPAGFGVKLMPHVDDAKLTPDQLMIFREYGYPPPSKR